MHAFTLHCDRLESLHIKTMSGQAKVLGTLVGIGGAMLLTFYKGVKINIWPKSFNIMKAHQGKSHAIPHQDQDNLVKGLMLAFASCISYSIWLIIQVIIPTY